MDCSCVLHRLPPLIHLFGAIFCHRPSLGWGGEQRGSEAIVTINQQLLLNIGRFVR